MKKSIIALLCAGYGCAFAQSSVTLSGSLEFAYKRDVLGNSTYGGSKGDRNFLTFAGVEDLGGGNSANFMLQQRFRIESGAPGTYMVTSNPAPSTQPTAFEQTAIGLTSPTFGAVRLGRFTNIIGYNTYNFQEDSPYGTQTSSQYGRLSGQIQYTSPDFNGFKYVYLQAQKALNISATVAGNGFTTGGATNATHNLIAHTVNYNGGPIFAQASYVTGLQGEKSYHIGGTYDFGSGIKVSAGQFSQSDPLVIAGAGQLAFKNNMVGVEYRTGPWVLAANYTKATDKIVAAYSGNQQKVGLKAYYSLSKRTTLEFEGVDTSHTTATTDGFSWFAGIRHTF